MIFEIGDRVELLADIDRFFGGPDYGEHGTIIGFFTMPNGDIDGLEFAKVQWDDGSISSVPSCSLESEDITDDLWIDDDMDFE